MTMVTNAPGMPSGLRYGRTMLGMFLRSTMNDRPCIAYEIIAPNTAMLSSVAADDRAALVSGQRRTTRSAWWRSRAIVPANSAMCGTFFALVSDMNGR